MAGISDVAGDLGQLETVLCSIRSSLDLAEAEEGGTTVHGATKKLKKEIKEWAYDAADVLDEWKFEQLRAEVEAPSFGLRRYPPDPVTDLSTDPSFRRRVDDLKQRGEEFGQSNCMPRPEEARGHLSYVQLPPTCSLPGEGEIYGRDDDMYVLVKFLLEGAIEEENLSVVPILGAAGVGKTTLVQHIFHDPEVSQHFNLKEWVSASGGRQMMELMRAIGESLSGVPCNSHQLEAVQDLLKRKLDGQKFLLVLDDVWYDSIDGDQWEVLCSTLRGCKDGSVVILTTQEERVADRTETVPRYILESLSDDCSWLVFQKHAFAGSLPADDRLLEIGQKIAMECQGSPLVSKALGLRLRHERDAAKWKELFLQTDMWLEAVPEVRLSYHRLPADLKRCFIYCSMFPKGYHFDREELVRLWIAQGLIEEKRGRSPEDVGIEYFDDLFIRSFFRSSELDTGAFVIPRLLRALGQSISDGEGIATTNGDLLDLQNLYHLFLTPSGSKLSVQSLCFTTNLRSLLVYPPWPPQSIAHVSLSEEALCSLDRLRVLDVRYTNITNLLDVIGNLKQLRYLSLQGTNIRDVHPSVFKLYNLQTLNLSGTRIKELPDLFGNLKLLNFLFLRRTRIERLPVSIWQLRNLRTLAWNRMGAVHVSKK